jgi:RNA polymerase sigma-70 factor (ECF subfamily)
LAELDAWADAVRSGDRAAFDAIVRATERAMFRVAARLLGDYDEAGDVLQDAYVRAFEALTSGEFVGRSSVSTWLYRVVTNASLDALRARKRRRAVPIEEASDAGRDGAAESRIALRELGALLDALPDEQRAALVLKELEGLSTAEAAKVLGTTEGAVEQRLVRARATLRSKVGDA